MADTLKDVDEIGGILQAAYKKKILTRFEDGSGVIIQYIMGKDEFPWKAFHVMPSTLERVLEKYPKIKLK